MPSSAEHCGACMLASLSEADEDTIFLEERSVEGHILALKGIENAAAIDMSRQDLASDRVLAAHDCARIIRAGGCARFVSLVVRSGIDTAKVFFVERDETLGK